ncbi:MAG: hypothetical protein IJ503_04160 [Akkermansia sp.]|nr:hypothetical protein [Akkermansia sp.]
MEDSNDKLVYHIKYARPLRGWLWLFVFPAFGVMVAVLLLVKVKMPEPLPPAKVGNVQYRNDGLHHLQVVLRSAMPLPLPAYVDPARREEAAAQELPSSFVPKLQNAPAERVFTAAHDSAVLHADDLLALPPQGLQDTPPAADGEEVQP